MTQPPYAAPPSYAPWPQPLGASGPRRPAVVTTAATLAVTASLEWLLALSLVWLTAYSAAENVPASGAGGGVDAFVTRVHAGLSGGLAWPLYLFALASFLSGFLVLVQRPWTRLVHTLLGVAALAWSAWWLRDDLVWWLPPATYVVVACAILWTPAATRWYRRSA